MKRVLCVLLAACMCAGAAGCGNGKSYGALKKENEELQQENEGLKKKNEEFERQVEALNLLLTASGEGNSDTESGSDSQTGATGTEGNAADNQPAADDHKTQEDRVYGAGETWTVDGMWNLTFTSAVLTEERNQFEESNPAQVVILNYTYENLGYVGRSQDLYITSMDMRFVDDSGQMCDTYPLSGENRAQPTPEGAKCDASEAVGIKSQSSNIKIVFNMRDSNGKKQEATFELPIQ